MGVLGIPTKYQLLYHLVRQTNPKVAVETGVKEGVSSSFILKGMEQGGVAHHLYSIDLPNQAYKREGGEGHDDRLLPGRTVGFMVPKSLRRNWSLVIGDSRTELPKLLDTLGSVDFFLHDSMHTYDHMTFEYEAVWPKIRSGGVLASDDTDWNGAFTDFCSKHKTVPLSGHGGLAWTVKGPEQL
jgi:predicted O-methyltransferase YrrM